MIKHTEEFKQEAVRIALTSGLPRDRVASDLGIVPASSHDIVIAPAPSNQSGRGGSTLCSGPQGGAAAPLTLLAFSKADIVLPDP
jgi:hypothetical protein